MVVGWQKQTHPNPTPELQMLGVMLGVALQGREGGCTYQGTCAGCTRMCDYNEGNATCQNKLQRLLLSGTHPTP